MTLDELEVAMTHLQAKSPSERSDSGTSLFRHSLDVTQQMAQFHALYRPEWPLSPETVCVPRILAYSALAHDLGKIHAGFQQMLKGGAPFDNRHEILSLAFLDRLDIPASERVWVEAAVGLHHKNLCRLTGPHQPFFMGGALFGTEVSHVYRLAQGVKREDLELITELLSHAPEVFTKTGWSSFVPYASRSRTCNHIESIRAALGRVSELADRFRQQLDTFGRTTMVPWKLRQAAILVRGFILSADDLASFRTHSLDAGLESVAAVRQALSNKIPDPNSHQRKAEGQNGSAVLVAPTGSGKTEAGLLWSARQKEAGVCGRTYVLLPYQASMNAMQARLIEVVAPDLRDNPEEWMSHVALIHGRSLRVAYEKLLEREYSPRVALHLAREQNDLARLNAAPIRICSPFQVLRFLFYPNGVEGLLLSLSKSRLIFDEIHAYDSDVTALALTATQMLVKHLGARCLFMTATLPSHLLRILEKMFDPLPCIRPDTDVMSRRPRHRLRLLQCHALHKDAERQIYDAARDGSVLVVVNQVRRAIDLYRRLRGALPDVHLLHSRFNAQDRFRKERELQPVPGRILVATQAVEVSLNVDYDHCFSELAPLESLLQRFGRCNRFGKRGEPAEVRVFEKFPDGPPFCFYPYKKEHLEQVAEVLHAVGHDGEVLREDETQRILDDSYPEAMKRELAERINTRVAELQEHYIDCFVPFGAVELESIRNLARQWEALFDGEEVLPECLRADAAREASTLARARHLVPISQRRFAMLHGSDKLHKDPELLCYVVALPYTDVGLEF